MSFVPFVQFIENIHPVYYLNIGLCQSASIHHWKEAFDTSTCFKIKGIEPEYLPSAALNSKSIKFTKNRMAYSYVFEPSGAISIALMIFSLAIIGELPDLSCRVLTVARVISIFL